MGMLSPLVSIIIPTFNRSTIILDTLNSIFNQTYTNWECIIVDDGSTDDTFEKVNRIISNDARVQFLKRPIEKVKGANSCRNVGLTYANGKYIIFFDSDDLMSESCLEKRISIFEEKQEYDILVFSMGVFTTIDKLEVYPFRKVINESLEKTIENFVISDKLPWNVCRPIFKSSLIKNKIFFNENIHNFQDEEFNIRLLGILQPKYLSIDITDCYYRFDDKSVNKYNTVKGNQDIVNSLFDFYQTIFKVFSKHQKKEFKRELLQKFFNHIRFYALRNIDKSSIYKTLRLFEREMKLSFKQKVIFHLILGINKFYYHKKGYNYFVRNLKNAL